MLDYYYYVTSRFDIPLFLYCTLAWPSTVWYHKLLCLVVITTTASVGTTSSRYDGVNSIHLIFKFFIAPHNSFPQIRLGWVYFNLICSFITLIIQLLITVFWILLWLEVRKLVWFTQQFNWWNVNYLFNWFAEMFNRDEILKNWKSLKFVRHGRRTHVKHKVCTTNTQACTANVHWPSSHKKTNCRYCLVPSTYFWAWIPGNIGRSSTYGHYVNLAIAHHPLHVCCCVAQDACTVMLPACLTAVAVLCARDSVHVREAYYKIKERRDKAK